MLPSGQNFAKSTDVIEMISKVDKVEKAFLKLAESIASLTTQVALGQQMQNQNEARSIKIEAGITENREEARGIRDRVIMLETTLEIVATNQKSLFSRISDGALKVSVALIIIGLGTLFVKNNAEVKPIQIEARAIK